MPAAARSGSAAAALWAIWLAAALLSALPAAGAANGTWWKPAPPLTFQYQLIEKFDPQQHFIDGVQVYFLDGFDTTPEAVAALKARGAASGAPVYPVCYISAGTREDWRPDAAAFTQRDLGDPLPNWPGERWLDVSSANVRAVMRKRLEMCRDKGFVAVDPDSVNAYTNPNGLGLTSADQLAYNRWLAAAAHELGLAVSLKNDLYQLKDLMGDFDMFVNEQCHAYEECGLYEPVLAAGKPVFNLEYDPTAFKTACKNATQGVASIFKRVTLDACRSDCSSPTFNCTGQSISLVSGAVGRSSLQGRTLLAPLAAAAAALAALLLLA